MSVLDWFRRSPGGTAPNGAPVEFAPTFMFSAEDVADVVSGLYALSPEKIYERTSDLRTVLDFRARNFSQIGMHAYQLQDNGGRERVRDSVTAKVLKRPAPGMTWPALMWAVCLDFDLHAETYLLFNPKIPAMVHIPARRVSIVDGSWELGDFKAAIRSPAGDKVVEVGAESLIPIRLYNPGGKSPMQTLKDVMAEQAAAQAFRLRTWKNGHQTNRYIHRPKDAPDWTPESRNRFVEDMRKFRAGGGSEGGSPLLEDGMEFRNDQFKATDDQFLEMAKLSRERYAAAYGVTLSMLGSGEGVTYANLREYRQMLYSETLGSLFSTVESALNSFLLPIADPGRDDLYLEFNLKERLKSDPKDQAAIYQAAVGGPYMTRAEARARENLPAIDGTEELITPLNVVTGAVASPQDTDGTEGQLSASELRSLVVPGKARGRSTVVEAKQTDVDAVESVLLAYFARQRSSVLSELGAGATELDYERWDTELYHDLNKVIPGISRKQTQALLSELDLDITFDAVRARSVSTLLSDHTSNITTQNINKFLKSADPAHDFDVIEQMRAAQYADTIVSSMNNMRAVDVAKQGAKALDREAYKVWTTTSGDSRPAHAAMNGERAKVGDPFSNGAMFPRSSVLGPAGVANCQCQIIISIEG